MVKRQLRNGSFRELNETRIYSNVTEMDATIEGDTSQNTNSLISSGSLLRTTLEMTATKKITPRTNERHIGIF